MTKKGVIICLLLVFLISFVNASFQIGNLSHTLTQTAYGPETAINGWINISLTNEPANSLFVDSNSNSITLIDLLKKSTNSGVIYSCSTSNCVSDYSATNSQASKTFNLNSNSSKIIGIKLTENVISVENVGFSVQSNANESCTNQLKIDFLNDGVVEKANNKSFNGYCTPNPGCFDRSRQTTNYIIGNESLSKHCQKFNLTESPGFKLGAWVKRNNDSRVLQMGLYETDGELLGKCNLSVGNSSGGQVVFCDVDYLVTAQKSAYVCIYGVSGNGNSAQIRGYVDSSGCGFYNEFFGQGETHAFDIFIEGKKFDDVSTLKIINSLPNENSLSEIIYNYLASTYDGICSDQSPCYVPIKFISNANQQITVNQIDIDLETSGGGITIDSFYDFSETPARINANFQKIFLNEGGFTSGQAYGNETFKLKLGNNEIFSQNLSIERVPIINYLEPTTAAYGFPTEFRVSINASSNISRYEWDFGNNQTYTTTSNKISHTYNSSGAYYITVTAIDSSQRSSSKTFNISVTSPEEKINSTLYEMLNNLANIKTQIERFDLASQERLKTFLDIENTEAILTELQRNFTQADTTQEYYEIIETLLSLNIPESIVLSKKADSFLYYPDINMIDLNVIVEITRGNRSISDDQKYIDAILIWNQRNIETRINFREFSAKKGSFIEPILNVFELDIKEKESLESNPYLIFKDMENLDFKPGFNIKNISGFNYLELSGSEKVVFSTTENVNFVNLPVFISPALSKLYISDNQPIPVPVSSKWTLFILILALLLVVGFSIYTFLQIWYKKKYENYLFPNKNNLYNVANYIINGRNQGLSDNEITNNLKKVKWGSEQISYVMKKISGKRTGMYELPIGKALEIFDKKQEAPKPIGNYFPSPQGFQKGKFQRGSY